MPTSKIAVHAAALLAHNVAGSIPVALFVLLKRKRKNK